MIYSIKIIAEDYKKCDEFAKQSVHTHLDEYSKRDQKNSNKIYLDILTGKLAEMAVYYYLSEKGQNPTYPDLEIYPADQKSFSRDIKIDNYKVHVKGQIKESADIFGLSWCFHPGDKLTFKPDDNDIVFFCLVDKDSVIIQQRCHASKLIGLYKPPAKKNLKNKIVILYEDIK